MVIVKVKIVFLARSARFFPKAGQPEKGRLGGRTEIKLLLYFPVLNSQTLGGEADADLDYFATVGLIRDGIALGVNLV